MNQRSRHSVRPPRISLRTTPSNCRDPSNRSAPSGPAGRQVTGTVAPVPPAVESAKEPARRGSRAPDPMTRIGPRSAGQRRPAADRADAGGQAGVARPARCARRTSRSAIGTEAGPRRDTSSSALVSPANDPADRSRRSGVHRGRRRSRWRGGRRRSNRSAGRARCLRRRPAAHEHGRAPGRRLCSDPDAQTHDGGAGSADAGRRPRSAV